MPAEDSCDIEVSFFLIVGTDEMSIVKKFVGFAKMSVFQVLNMAIVFPLLFQK